MQYRSLGRTELKVSEIGFGTGPTAGLMVRGTEEEQTRIVARAIEDGVTYYDTAPVYGDTASESHLGKVFAELGVHPVVATKVALEEPELDDIPGSVVRSLENSLQRLGMEAVDVVYLHNRVAAHRAGKSDKGAGALLSVEDVIGPGGVLEGFERLRDQGKVRYLGCCAFGGEMAALRQVIQTGRFDSLLAHYSILNPTAARPAPPGFNGFDYEEVMLRAADVGMGIVALRVLEAGALTGSAERHPLAGELRGSGADAAYQESRRKASALGFLMNPGEVSLAQPAIRFALARPEVSTVIVGFSAMEHLEQAVDCSGAAPFTPDQLDQLEKLYASDFQP